MLFHTVAFALTPLRTRRVCACPVKRCPQCFKPAAANTWLCECGYEFNGSEPETQPTGQELIAVQRHRTSRLTIVCVWLLLASFVAVSIAGQFTYRPASATLSLIAFCGFGISFLGLCRGVLRAARGRPFVILGGAVLLLLGLFSFFLSAVTVACSRW